MKIKSLFQLLSLVGWVAISTVVISQLHSYHLISFYPNRDLAAHQQGMISVTHVLGTGCKCSDVIRNYLISRGSLKGISESVIYLVDGKKSEAANLFTQQLKEKGFQVSFKDQESFSEFESKVTGVPFMMVSDTTQNILYAGGYGSHKILEGQDIQDQKIIEQIVANKKVYTLPIFGCATSLKYQSLIDPFSFKYPQGASR